MSVCVGGRGVWEGGELPVGNNILSCILLLLMYMYIIFLVYMYIFSSHICATFLNMSFTFNIFSH